MIEQDRYRVDMINSGTKSEQRRKIEGLMAMVRGADRQFLGSSEMSPVTRRSMIFGMAAIAAGLTARQARAAPRILVSKDPACGCCSGWIEHIRSAGFDAHVNNVSDLAVLKRRFAIPAELASCHTAEVDGYVIEGHVPAAAVRRLLAERPAATGLAVAGMPVGSPGMEAPGSPDETYDVILFGRTGQRVYARYKGLQELKSQL